jgi:hypothetical protein
LRTESDMVRLEAVSWQWVCGDKYDAQANSGRCPMSGHVTLAKPSAVGDYKVGVSALCMFGLCSWLQMRFWFMFIKVERGFGSWG